MRPEDIEAVCDLVHQLCGLSLDSSKDYLIDSRLSRLLEQEKVPSYSDLVQLAKKSESCSLRTKIVNAITTQETLFFRDQKPFEALKNKAIPESIDARSKSIHPKKLRIWSAACSTGQEPYSIAMTLFETIPDIQSWDISITATDISDEALSIASRGWYSEYEVSRGLDQSRLDRFFVADNRGYKISDEIRFLLKFQKVNLLEENSQLGCFDIIFCRNVVIYFDPEDRKRAYYSLVKQLDPHGYLFVGSSESLVDLGPNFQAQHHCSTVFYQPNRTLPEYVIANQA